MFCLSNQQNTIQETETVKKIGSYLFRYSDLLGQGNFSTVYSGVDENTGKLVAVKVIKMSSLKSKTALKLLQNEILILKDLQNPSVIKCFDSLTSINNCYIITQLCTSDLDKLLKKRGRFQEKQINRWIYDILKGLQYLESCSIIHRDLKINNIFISSNGSLKIADFGFAIKAKQTFKDLNIGSPIYMSPQGLIFNQYGPKTDVWSLGIMIYQLLHGDTPLDHCRSQQQLKNKVLEPVNIRVKISAQLRKFIDCCLKINQHERFSVSQLLETQYFKRISYELQSQKSLKAYSSGKSSSYNSTIDISSQSQNSNKFQIIQQISYQSAVALLHYCRMIHKTCQKLKSQILSQWLLNVSFELLKSKISRNHTDKQQYQKLKQVIIEYHNKYQRQHEDSKVSISIVEALKQSQIMLQKHSQLKHFLNVLLNQTKLIKKTFQNGKIQHFGKFSQSKKYLSSIQTNNIHHK